MIVEFILGLLLLFALFYWYMTKNFKKFEDAGVPYMPPSFPLGSESTKEFFARKKHAMDIMRDIYQKWGHHRFYGFFAFRMAYVTVNDPAVIRDILVKDFHKFVDRQASSGAMKHGSKTDQIWTKQLTMMKGDEWKKVRATFSPIFTSGKMKGMMGAIHAVCRELSDHIGKFADKDQAFEAKEVFTKFTIGSITSCTFGADAGAFAEEEAPMYKHAVGMGADRSTRENLMLFATVLPGVMRLFGLLGISVLKPVETMFFFDLVKQAVALRKEQGSNGSRNDLVDLMIRAMREDIGKHEVDDDEQEQFERDAALNYKPTKGSGEIDEVSICATAMVILLAGFDTTSSALAFAAWELVKNPDIQRRLQEEIDAVENPNVDYNTVVNMEYLDMICHETLRKYPIAPLLQRGCLEDYKIPGSNYTIPKGMNVLVNTIGLHFDEKYYPDPDKFIPERFSKDEKAKRDPYTFLPFGQGPRGCIGMRFALLEMKLALFHLLSNYELVSCETTPETMEFSPTANMAKSKTPLEIKAVRRS